MQLVVGFYEALWDTRGSTLFSITGSHLFHFIIRFLDRLYLS